MNASPLSVRVFDDSDHDPIDPFALFEEWLAAAKESEPNDPNAMALATVDDTGLPDVRMVLLNARDHRGFCWFTNFGSAKARQARGNGKAALCFHWKSLRRQVRMRGPIEVVTDAEADAYFATRSRGSQIGAHASEQSQPLESKAVLAGRVATLEKELGDDPVTRPPHWSGFRLTPTAIEFWKDGAFRLHDRMQFTRDTPTADWTRRRLNP